VAQRHSAHGLLTQCAHGPWPHGVQPTSVRPCGPQRWQRPTTRGGAACTLDGAVTSPTREVAGYALNVAALDSDEEAALTDMVSDGVEVQMG
jgi:hypothetical protein